MRVGGRESIIAACSLLIALGVCGCADGEEREGDQTHWEDMDKEMSAGDDLVEHPTRCRPSDAALGSPRSVEDVVALINGLPRPVTIACVMESLDRPLRIYATQGTVSAQPAAGARSPRIFVFLEPLILSIVPDGDGSVLLELSVMVDNLSTLKAELPFPVEGALHRADPYTHVVRSDRGTSCGLCHASERRYEAIGFAPAYTSAALRPVASERVPLARLRAEHAECDAAREPRRCAILAAVFGWGEVRDGTFPEHYPTFY